MKTGDVNPTAPGKSRQEVPETGNDTIACGDQSGQDQLRCDLPHRQPAVSSSQPAADGQVDAAIEELIQTDPHQLQLHASQLAELLQHRLQDLDRREAEFQANLAGWEQECRQWRSQVQQQEKEQQQKQRQLTAEHRVVCQQSTEMAIDQVAWEQDVAEFNRSHQRQQESLDQIAARLVAQQQQLAESEIQLAEEQAQWALQYQNERLEWEQMCQRKALGQKQQESQLAELADTLDRWKQRIEEREAVLEEEADQFKQVQQEYHRERQDLLVEHEQCHREWQEDQEREQRELRLAWEELTRRQVETGQREVESRQLQDELRALQQRVLENQAAIEQLCSQAEKETPQSQLPKWFHDIREQLRQYHRCLGDEVLEREAELQQVGEALTQRQQGLTQQHRRLSRWAQQEQRRIDQRSAQIAVRESELGRLHHQYQQQKQAWIERRRRQQRRLRRLLAA